jgi:hypothetical protein
MLPLHLSARIAEDELERGGCGRRCAPWRDEEGASSAAQVFLRLAACLGIGSDNCACDVKLNCSVCKQADEQEIYLIIKYDYSRSISRPSSY